MRYSFCLDRGAQGLSIIFSVQEGVSEGMPEQKIFADDETWRSENRKLWDTCKVDALFDTEVR
jgi:hypothetical protein